MVSTCNAHGPYAEVHTWCGCYPVILFYELYTGPTRVDNRVYPFWVVNSRSSGACEPSACDHRPDLRPVLPAPVVQFWERAQLSER